MYRIFLSILLLASSLPVFAERTVTTIQPYYMPYNTSQAYYGGDYIPPRRYAKTQSAFPDINDLEKYAMNRNFTKDSDIVRIERLENLAFGAIQEGDIYTRYDNVRASILSRPKQNYKTSVLKSLSNYFNGHLTGFTPQINNSYNPYLYSIPSGFNQSSYTQYHSPWGSRYRINNYGIGSGSGVHILD